MAREPARRMLILPAEGAAPALAAALEAGEIACAVAQNAVEADALIAIAHPRDTALLLADDAETAKARGFDGVHLSLPDGQIGPPRKILGEDAIIGTFCGVSRHVGMMAGEAGADYVAFGPCDDPDTAVDAGELITWWQEQMETPCVGWRVDPDDIEALESYGADFVALRG